MANTLIKAFIDKAKLRVVDEDMIRWDLPFWITALNDAINAVITIRPDAHSKTTEFTCVAGTIQTLDENCNILLDVIRNIDGKAVRGLDDMEMINNYRPEWIESIDQKSVDCYMQDESTPNTFYIYPGVSNQHKLLIAVSIFPDPITQNDYASNKKIAISPVYDNAIIEYMIYLAFIRDAEFASNASNAALAQQAFFNLLGVKSKADSQFYKSYQRNQQTPK